MPRYSRFFVDQISALTITNEFFQTYLCVFAKMCHDPALLIDDFRIFILSSMALSPIAGPFTLVPAGSQKKLFGPHIFCGYALFVPLSSGLGRARISCNACRTCCQPKYGLTGV